MPLLDLLTLARVGRAVLTTARTIAHSCFASSLATFAISFAIAFALATGTPATSSAQTTESVPRAENSTIWVQLGLGGSSAQLVCDICQSARDVGPSINIALGAYASDRLRVGLEASSWRYENPTVRERLQSFGLVAHFAPPTWQRLHLLGGLGWTGYRAGDFSYDAPRVTLGLGWDLPFTQHWVIGNIIAVDAASFGSLRNGDVTVAERVGHNALRVTTQLRRR